MAETKLDPAAILDSALELDGEVAPYYSYFDTSRGAPLSVTNMLTLYMQGADEIVGTRSQWANVGHTPQPDAQRYYIWVPLFAKRPKEGGKEGELEEVFIGRYKPVWCMIPLSQTEGEPLPAKPVPGFSVPQMLDKMAMRMVPFNSIYGGLQGYSRGVEIAISPIASDPFRTTIHEAGHIACGHTLDHALDNETYHRGIQEFQAEGIAYVVLKLLNVMDEQAARYSRGYIKHYLQNEKPPESAIRQVLSVADRIWRAGRVAPAAGYIALAEPAE